MAAVTSTYTDPSDSFVWWVEGDKVAIATTKGDGGTTETAEGKYKAAVIGSGTDYISNGLLIDFVKAHLLFDAAAKEKDPNQSIIKSKMGERFLNNFNIGIRKYGMKKNDKTGGTRAIVPADLR
jgi:hypothetical protein